MYRKVIVYAKNKEKEKEKAMHLYKSLNIVTNHINDRLMTLAA